MVPATRTPKAAVSELLPGVSVSFQPKSQQSRFDVMVSSPLGHALDGELTNALQAVGFKPGTHQPPQADGLVTQSFEREGYGLLGGWTAAERERLTSELRRTLRRFGFTMVPEIKAA